MVELAEVELARVEGPRIWVDFGAFGDETRLKRRRNEVSRGVFSGAMSFADPGEDAGAHAAGQRRGADGLGSGPDSYFACEMRNRWRNHMKYVCTCMYVFPTKAQPTTPLSR